MIGSIHQPLITCDPSKGGVYQFNRHVTAMMSGTCYCSYIVGGSCGQSTHGGSMGAIKSTYILGIIIAITYVPPTVIIYKAIIIIINPINSISSVIINICHQVRMKKIRTAIHYAYNGVCTPGVKVPGKIKPNLCNIPLSSNVGIIRG